MNGQTSVEVVTWYEALDRLSSQVSEPSTGTLAVVASRHHQAPDLPCAKLEAAGLSRLAESLVGIAGVPDYTPTSIEPPIPLRLDAMLHRLLHQPSGFLAPLLRNWCEWFGLCPSRLVSDAWTDFIESSGAERVDLPAPFDKLVERRLICAGAENLYLPLPVAVALTRDTQLPGWDAMPNLLHQVRHSLLSHYEGGGQQRLYQQLTAFLRTPHPSLDGYAHRTARARGSLVDISCYDWSVGVSKPVIEAVLLALQALCQRDAERYQEVFNRVHGPVWDSVAKAMEELNGIDSRSLGDSLIIDPTDYADSCRSVSRELKSISRAYTILTEMETALGVDRYLGGLALAHDLSKAHDRVRRIAQSTHRALDAARHTYLREWNLAEVESVVLGLLGLADPGSRLIDYFPNDQRCVIFLLVDALGYTQFHWFLNTVAQRGAAPLAGNVFAWLQDKGVFNDSYVLASNLVSITGACLPTIYTGALPRETGVIGSNMIIEGHHLNVLRGTDQHHKLTRSEVADLYQRNVNLELIPFAERAYESGVDVRVFHGGSMRFKPLADYTYGILRKEGRVSRVSKADRVFAEATPEVLSWADPSRQKHLALVYYPLIDHSGHGCGPYTQFQAAELRKLNFVLTHFLVDLASEAETLFDGRTSMVVTADHGMFESATCAVSHRTVRNALGGKGACRGMRFVYDNRAMYIYGVDEAEMESVRRVLVEYFDHESLPISVATRNDPLVTDLLCDRSTSWVVNCPDIILQFHGPGVFYYNEDLPSHMFLYGAHGGVNVEETFVPLIHFTLTPDLAAGLRRFL